MFDEQRMLSKEQRREREDYKRIRRKMEERKGREGKKNLKRDKKRLRGTGERWWST